MIGDLSADSRLLIGRGLRLTHSHITDLNLSLSVTDDHELGERHVWGHLDRPPPLVPLVPVIGPVIVSEILADVSFYWDRKD